MTFLPYAFTGLGTDSWGLSLFSIKLGGEARSVYIFGDERGLGYLVTYEIAATEEDVEKAKKEAEEAVISRNKTVPEQQAILDSVF